MQTIIEQFYTAFAQQNVEDMIACYHKEIIFSDPAFGTLAGEEVAAMWRMLIARSKGNLKIEYQVLNAHSAQWQAEYYYGKNQRKVNNQVTAHFTFKEGLIYRHEDHFDLWKWSRQALGTSGWLLGWSGLMRKKVQQQTRLLLNRYKNNT